MVASGRRWRVARPPAAEAVPVVRLTEVFRQAAHSRIVTTAHRINGA